MVAGQFRITIPIRFIANKLSELGWLWLGVRRLQDLFCERLKPNGAAPPQPRWLSAFSSFGLKQFEIPSSVRLSMYSVLYTFTAYNCVTDTNSDGAFPYGGVILSSNTLYGTAYNGGNAGYGTVFSISLPTPKMFITHSGSNLVMAWPTNLLNFTLQSTTNLDPVWSPVSLSPVIINGQNVVTNPISGAPQQFFRLGL